MRTLEKTTTCAVEKSNEKQGSPDVVAVAVAVAVAAVEYYQFLIIIIVVGPGAWLSHSAAEGYRFFSNIVATLARNATPPTGVLGEKKSNSVQ